MRTKPLNDFLHAEGGVGKLIAQAEKLLALQRAVTQLLPPHLRAAVRVVNLKADTLLLQAGNNAVAAKLKHFAPTLKDGLAQKGYHFGGIKVEVQPAQTNDAAPRRTRTLPPPAAEALRELERKLPDGSPLRGVLRTLAAKTR